MTKSDLDKHPHNIRPLRDSRPWMPKTYCVTCGAMGKDVEDYPTCKRYGEAMIIKNLLE